MQIVLVAHDIRSTHNVGAFFRTCDALGVQKMIFSGYTPYPTFEGDTRMPHFADKITRQIHKTALGAESSVDFEYRETLQEIIIQAQTEDAVLVALEQHPTSITPSLCSTELRKKFGGKTIYLLLGNEVHGVQDEVLTKMDYIMEIPMQGVKESLNVSVAAGIAIYALTNKE